MVLLFADRNPGLIPAGIGTICVGFMAVPPGTGDACGMAQLLLLPMQFQSSSLQAERYAKTP
ncbi:MAG: hypothetical protein AB7H90_06510 [Alphaproteobacteria bacterium]